MLESIETNEDRGRVKTNNNEGKKNGGRMTGE